MEAVVYKLQILYATNIQGADANMFSASPRTSDAYVVAVSYTHLTLPTTPYV